MNDINDIKSLVLIVLVVDVVGSIIYFVKGNPVGVFNCIAWGVITAFVLMNFNKVFKQP